MVQHNIPDNKVIVITPPQPGLLEHTTDVLDEWYRTGTVPAGYTVTELQGSFTNEMPKNAPVCFVTPVKYLGKAVIRLCLKGGPECSGCILGLS